MTRMTFYIGRVAVAAGYATLAVAAPGRADGLLLPFVLVVLAVAAWDLLALWWA